MFSLVLLVAQAAGNETTKSSPKRNFSFPTQISIGSLLLIPDGKPIDAGKLVAGAQGKVSVVIPPNQWLILELNQRVFLHPELLDTVSPVSIDAMRVAFLSMEEGEEVLCDKVLLHLHRFNELKHLVLDNSDVTDGGIDSLSSMSGLTDLSAEGSQVRGRFLKKGTLPQLSRLVLTRCTMDSDSFQYLSKYAKLQKLALAQINLNASELKEVGRCHELTELDISGNPMIDDGCMKLLLPLKHLVSLKLGSTHVTGAGAAVLKPLKLTNLEVPNTCGVKDVALIRAALPNTLISAPKDGKKRRHEIEEILAPTAK